VNRGATAPDFVTFRIQEHDHRPVGRRYRAVLSDTSDPLIADFARGTVCLLATRRRSDGDLFRVAVPIFERHLPEADGNRKETDKWEGSIVMLEAICFRIWRLGCPTLTSCECSLSQRRARTSTSSGGPQVRLRI
jgi:hypothetical protein